MCSDAYWDAYIPPLNPSPILNPLSSFFRDILMQRKSVAWCQFNLDGMTYTCLSQSEREEMERWSEAELRSWTFNPLSILNYLSLIHRLFIYCIHLSVSWSSKLPLWYRLKQFYIFPSVNFLSSPILPPSSCPLLYLPLLCVLPSPPFPSLSPPARSFPRTACSQHPLRDWLMGIKGPVLPPSTWLHSSYATVIMPITLAAAHCTRYTHSRAHMYMQQWIQRHTDIRCWQNIWHSHIHRLPCL